MCAIHDKVGPDFVRDDLNVMFNHQFYEFLDFPSFPNTTCWVMWVTEDSYFDVVFNNFLFHIFEVHSVCAFFVLFQFGENDCTFSSIYSTCEADVCWAVQENWIAFVCVNTDNVGNTTENRVFVGDNVWVFDYNVVSFFMPFDDSIVETCACKTEVTHSWGSKQSANDSVDN